MELYHKTLSSPTTHHLAQALHLEPVKPKEEYDKPRQLLLATNSSLQLYRYVSNQNNPQNTYKYDITPFHHE